MFITKKRIPRRTFLRGAGAVIAVPFLESMVPALSSVARGAEVSPKRFLGAFIPHGAAPGWWEVKDSSSRASSSRTSGSRSSRSARTSC